MRQQRLGMRAALAAGTSVMMLAGCGLLPVVEEGQGLYPFLPNGGEDSGLPVIDPDLNADLERFYTQELSFRECFSGLECFTIVAPLDWDNPTVGDIALEGVRTRAKGTRIGSLLVNPGGPGGSAIDQVAQYGSQTFGPELFAAFDIVGVDPRGVGKSSPVTCFGSDAEKDAYLLEYFTVEPGSDEFFAEVERSVREYAEGCERYTGPLMGFVDTKSAARDLDLIRALMGDAQLHYLGFSYGTYLGSMYAELFPERAGRLVLDGAVNPDEDAFEGSLTQAKGFDSALLAYLANCLDGSTCPLQGSPEQAADQLMRLLDGLDQRPLVASDGRVMARSAAVTAVITPLYAQETWFFLDMVIAELLDGKADLAFVMFDAYTGRENGRYSSNIMDAIGAVNCLDTDVSSVTKERLREEAAILEREAPYFGRFMTYGGYSCTVWPWTHRGYPDLRAEGAAPILVIGTTNDPATPYASAVALADKLASGVLVTFEGEGHTAYGQGNKCIADVVHDFLIRGVVPEQDPRCR